MKKKTKNFSYQNVEKQTILERKNFNSFKKIKILYFFIIIVIIGFSCIFLLKWFVNDSKEIEYPRINKNSEYIIIKKIEKPESSIVYTYLFLKKLKIINRQGLAFLDNNTLIESGGLYEGSSILLRSLENMTVINKKPLEEYYFGEGCDFFNEKIYQLTWRERKILIYNKEKFMKEKEIDLPSPIKEGWGLTHYERDGNLEIYITDGTDNIYILNSDWKIFKTLVVKNEKGESIKYLNELEIVNGSIFCNVYLSSKIIVIDIDNGNILKEFNFHEIVQEIQKTKYFTAKNLDWSHCLNGIAFNPFNNILLVTGKMWPYIYQIEIIY